MPTFPDISWLIKIFSDPELELSVLMLLFLGGILCHRSSELEES